MRTHVLLTLFVVVSDVQHMLCYVFVLFYFICQFLWIVHFLLPLRYSLTFIDYYNNNRFLGKLILAIPMIQWELSNPLCLFMFQFDFRQKDELFQK